MIASTIAVILNKKQTKNLLITYIKFSEFDNSVPHHLIKFRIDGQSR